MEVDRVIAIQLLEQMSLSPPFEFRFQRFILIKIFRNRFLAAADHKADISDPRIDALIHKEGNNRLVANRQEFFGHDLRPWKKTRTETCQRENCMSQVH